MKKKKLCLLVIGCLIICSPFIYYGMHSWYFDYKYKEDPFFFTRPRICMDLEEQEAKEFTKRYKDKIHSDSDSINNKKTK